MTEVNRPRGPVDMIVLALAGVPTGRTAAAILEAEKAGLIRILDVLYVRMDEEGNVTILEADGIDDQETLGFEAAHPGLIGEDDALAEADSLVPGLAVALIVWENAWAAEIAEAAQDAGTVVLAYEHIPTDDVDLILTALEAAEC
jgi:hypothetical protein